MMAKCFRKGKREVFVKGFNWAFNAFSFFMLSFLRDPHTIFFLTNF
jgi:hypothetical protein